MLKLKRLRRREAPVDVHSEDEEEFDATRGELEFSDLSDSEASCEDSDVESEASHSEGEEETQEEASIIKEEATTTREELSLTNEGNTNSVYKDASSLVEDTIATSSEDISENVTMSEEAKQPIYTDKEKLNEEIKQGENNSVVAKDSEVEDSVSSTDGDELQSHLGNENEVRDEKQDDSQNSVSVPEMSGWQKKVLARQEYRKKLAEDPAFVPHLGEFWGHDDRFIKDELRDDFDPHYRKSPFASRGKSVWGNPPRDRWDHDGFEELMKIEDEEKRRKEFQRRIQHRREFVPPAPRRRSNFHKNITPPKFNHSRPSNSIRKRRNSFEEQSRSRGMFLSKHDTNNKGGNISSNNFNHHKSSVRGRSESSYNGNVRNVTSASRLNDNKPFAGKDNSFPPKGRNGFRGRGYSSRHYMRSNLNQVNSNQADVNEMDGSHNLDHDKNSKEQHLNSDDVDNKNSHVTHNTEQQESHENEVEDKRDTVAENQIEKAEPAQEPTDVTSHVNITSSSFTKEGMESGSSIKGQESVREKSEESGVEIILDSQSKKATEDNVTHSTSQSIDNVTSSFNELSINNNNQSDTIALTLADKDRAQTSQSSKRYSTRRAASFSITQPTQTNDSPASGISNNPRTSEIPPSAVFAPPFQPRALALSDESSISNEDSSNNFFPQKPETPIAYYVDNLPQGLRNNENNLPQPTSIPPAPYVAENNPYGTESNGMVYYYDPNVYYYYYPTHTTPELKDTTDNSVKSSSFISQPPTTEQENDGVYYYYHPVYYQ